MRLQLDSLSVRSLPGWGLALMALTASGVHGEEKTLHGDRDCGTVVELNRVPRFTAPPASFGNLR